LKKLLLFTLLALLFSFLYHVYTFKGIPKSTKVDKLEVNKAERQLLAYANGKLVKTYAISLGRQPRGDKKYQGDNKTPEGLYFITDKNPNSQYYKSLGVSYPNRADRKEAARLSKPVGGDIKIHGLPGKTSFLGKLHLLYDWTAGCMAVTNTEIEELYQAVPVGTPIQINP
jgi:murein L,D-transpeptidase YafK